MNQCSGTGASKGFAFPGNGINMQQIYGSDFKKQSQEKPISMKKFQFLFLWIAVCFVMTACSALTSRMGSPTGKTSLKDELLAIETRTHEALQKKDAVYVSGLTSRNFVGYFMGRPMGRDEVSAAWKTMDCEIRSQALSEVELTEISPEIAVLSFKTTRDGTCPNGPMPKQLWAATLYVKEEGNWKAGYHQSVAIPETDAAKPAESAKSQSAPAPTVAAKSDALSQELIKREFEYWEGFKNNDATVFEKGLSSNFMYVRNSGRIGKAETIKSVADKSCTIKSHEIWPTLSAMAAPDVAVILYSGTQTDVCGGEEASYSSNNATISKKVDGAWQAVFHFEVIK